jgi:pimeloyl-ACP methyl ester carboxylesterase
VPTARLSDVELAYEVAGSRDDEPLLLVNGLGGQLISWRPGLVTLLAERGFYVVRFDNRDSGLSTKFTKAPPPDLGAILAGDHRTSPYRVESMADDAAALLEALGIAPVHVVGISMGGMIAQALAIGRPDLVRSLASIMSSTGRADVGQPSAAALEVLTSPPATDRRGVVEEAVRSARVIGSPGFAFDEEDVRQAAAAAYDRAWCPEGTVRQLAAILASPDRTPALEALTVPTVVIHGEADALVDPSGGRATAAAIPGASLVMVPGMGHDLPAAAWGTIVEAIAANAERAIVAGGPSPRGAEPSG